MKLSQDEFDQCLAQGELTLCFVGMSNIGKSYTAGIIARDCLFDHIELDALIQDGLGLQDMNALAEWMGFPFEDSYESNSRKYINLESQLIENNIIKVSTNTILDVTGSAIYCEQATLHKLKSSSLIVHISAGADSIETLTERFSTDPKPLIWGDGSENLGSLDDMEQLMAAYPKLLENREHRYSDLADIRLSSEELSKIVRDGGELLALIKAQLD